MSLTAKERFLFALPVRGDDDLSPNQASLEIERLQSNANRIGTQIARRKLAHHRATERHESDVAHIEAHGRKIMAEIARLRAFVEEARAKGGDDGEE